MNTCPGKYLALCSSSQFQRRWIMQLAEFYAVSAGIFWLVNSCLRSEKIRVKLFPVSDKSGLHSKSSLCLSFNPLNGHPSPRSASLYFYPSQILLLIYEIFHSLRSTLLLKFTFLMKGKTPSLKRSVGISHQDKIQKGVLR